MLCKHGINGNFKVCCLHVKLLTMTVTFYNKCEPPALRTSTTCSYGDHGVDPGTTLLVRTVAMVSTK